jgi:hypothetical protein
MYAQWLENSTTQQEDARHRRARDRDGAALGVPLFLRTGDASRHGGGPPWNLWGAHAEEGGAEKAPGSLPQGLSLRRTRRGEKPEINPPPRHHPSTPMAWPRR